MTDKQLKGLAAVVISQQEQIKALTSVLASWIEYGLDADESERANVLRSYLEQLSASVHYSDRLLSNFREDLGLPS